MQFLIGKGQQHHKNDLKILDKPIIFNKQRADILAQIAAITLLLQRAFAFIVKISALLIQYNGHEADPETVRRPHNKK